VRLGWNHIGFILIFYGSTLWSQTKSINIDPFLHSESFISTGRDSLLKLSHNLIINGTVTIKVDSLILVEGRDYKLNSTSGVVGFVEIPDSGSVITVTYRILPVDLKIKYQHWRVSDTTVRDETHPPVISSASLRRKKKKSDFSENLQKSGSIFRGLSIGTGQGMKLQSGLRLQLSGMIAPRVEVIGSLTDQNTPIQPEGNTQTLQEIDKVFVKVRAPGFDVTMGDYVFNVDNSRFGSFSRKLQGGMGSVESNFGKLTISAAASRGEFTTNYFNGQEAHQGPYQLTGGEGQREIIVLAGTERVWVDGELMQRGEDNDYVIEYGNGQITFTRNRLITSDSRIRVDFEYSDQKFQKDIYGARGEVKFLNDRIKIRTSFLRESDNKDHPLDISLNDEYLDILKKAGDCLDSAVVSGAKYVGDSSGTYVRIDSSGIVFYRYAGKNKGDYSVHFSYVGEGKGDYSFSGYGIYKYEGEGRGDYLPIIYLPLATSHQLIDASTSIDLGGNTIIEGEVALSDRDLNLYSNKDDQDNIGLAYSGRLKMDRRRIALFKKGLGELAVEANLQSVGKRFRPVGRIGEVEHGRKWGKEEGTYWDEKIHELRTSYYPLKGVELRSEVGSMEGGGGFNSSRTMIEADVSKKRVPRVHYFSEWIKSKQRGGAESRWWRQRGRVSGRVMGLRPAFLYWGEDRKQSDPDSVVTGFNFNEWTLNCGFGSGLLGGEVSHTIRDDRRYQSAVLRKNSIAQTSVFKMGLRTRSGLSASVIYTHRRRDYYEISKEDQSSDLADMKFKYLSKNRFVNGTVNYRFSSTRVSEMVRDTIQVGEGLGNYRFDENLGEYVPDPDGDVIFRTIQTGNFIPVNNLKLGSELRLNGSVLWRKRRGLLGFLGKMETRSILRIEREDRKRNFFKVNRSAFFPDWGEDSTTVMGLFSFHQDIEYKSPVRGFSVRLRLRKEDSENRRLVGEGLLRRMDEVDLRIKGSFSRKVGIMLNIKDHKERKDYFSNNLVDRDIQFIETLFEASYRPKQKLEFAVKARLRVAEDLNPDPITKARSIFIIPRIVYSLKGRGHFRAEFEFGSVVAEPSHRALPYEMMKGDQPGRTIRWTVMFTYTIADHVMATFNYRGRKEPWRDKLYQYGNVEVRAFF